MWQSGIPDIIAVRARGGRAIEVVDMHTAGEPVRIIIGGYPALRGTDILAKRRDALEHHDDLRRSLMLEPRGHAGMYGVIPVRPSLPGAALGVLFTHAGGYSTMCGHATVAIARWAVDIGVVAPVGDELRFVLECPCGPVNVFATLEQGRVVKAGFESVPAFVDATEVRVMTERLGTVTCDIVYGGAYYALVTASDLGLDFEAAGIRCLASAAAHLFDAAKMVVRIDRPDAPDLAFLYGVIITDDAPWPSPSRNLCVFGDGQIDRSPTGSGVTARLAHAVLARGAPLGVVRTFFGPTSESFTGQAVRRLEHLGRHSVVARVEGRSYYSGTSTLVIEADDPLGTGFLLDQETGNAA